MIRIQYYLSGLALIAMGVCLAITEDIQSAWQRCRSIIAVDGNRDDAAIAGIKRRVEQRP